MFVGMFLSQGAVLAIFGFVGLCVYCRGLVIFFRCAQTRYGASAKRGFYWCLAGAFISIVPVAISAFTGRDYSLDYKVEIVRSQGEAQEDIWNRSPAANSAEEHIHVEHNAHGSFD